MKQLFVCLFLVTFCSWAHADTSNNQNNPVDTPSPIFNLEPIVVTPDLPTRNPRFRSKISGRSFR